MAANQPVVLLLCVRLMTGLRRIALADTSWRRPHGSIRLKLLKIGAL